MAYTKTTIQQCHGMQMLNSFTIHLSNQFYKYVASTLTLLLCISFANSPLHIHQGDEAQNLSKTTAEALDRVIQLNSEIGAYGGSVSELILKGSYLQDTFYSYLLQAEEVDEYNRGMTLFDAEMKNFRSISNYISNLYNFYTGSARPSNPQCITLDFNGQETTGYLNTFKVDRPLTKQEREEYFYQEYDHYMRDFIEKPFVLDSSNVKTLESDTLYNYVLLPDGTINVALERPGEREYQVRDEKVLEAFHYPNHTILAGDPEQAVLTAGAFNILQEGDKRLFFISCKSGHFQPYYSSIDLMRPQLARLGIHPYTVISVNDVDLSRSVLKTYKSTKIPLFISTHDCQRLFGVAMNRWNSTYESIDKDVLTSLSAGDFSVIDSVLIEKLRKQRAESTYMRSAFRLFSTGHDAPEWFSEFVKHYGKLKDLIKHYPRKDLSYDKIKAQATQLVSLIDIYEREKDSYRYSPADTSSFFRFYQQICSEILELLERPSLSKAEFHDLKKLSRELCAFFLYLSEDVKLKSKGFFIYRTCSESFYQINDLMAKSDYIYAPTGDGSKRLIVPRKIANQLLRNINHLSIAPPSFPLEFDSKEINSMINTAKDLYSSSHFTNIFLQKSIKNNPDGSEFDYPKALSYLQELLRDAEIARHAVIFFDKSHQSTDLLDQYIAITKQLIQACNEKKFNSIKDEAEEFDYLSYYAPPVLQSYVQTDQVSFNQTLKAYLAPLSILGNHAIISQELAEHVAENLQAFRDIINLCRRDSLLKKVDPSKYRLPTVCFDVLEEQADLLLEGLKMPLNYVVITVEMKLAADIILSRIDCDDVLSSVLKRFCSTKVARH